MLDVFNTFTQTKANIQTFYRDGVWVKPRGASFVYMLLLGGGGNGTAGNGGGSGSVTRWMGSAAIVPDNLVVSPSIGNADSTTIAYRGTTLTTLLTAESGNNTNAGAVSAATPFAASGFYTSVGGQAGVGGTVQSASATTFLSGGSATSVNANYGYSTTSTSGSFFLTQPIIVGCATATGGKRGDIGCGGSSGTGQGGPGLVIIASW